MARNDPQVNLRMPADLKERLDVSASANKRSLTAEIVERLEASYAWPNEQENLLRDRAQLKAELAVLNETLVEQKAVTRQVQTLMAEWSEDSHQWQDVENAIEKRFTEMKQQYELLEGLKEELAHLSHARGDSSAQTEALLRQQSELIDQLRINQSLSEQTITVFRDTFLDAASGDESAFERLLEVSRKFKKS